MRGCLLHQQDILSCQLFHLCMKHLRMTYFNNRFSKYIFNRNQCINSEVMSSTHPPTYFRLFFPKTQGKVFLLKALIFQNFVYSIHNLKRQINHTLNFRINLLASFLDYATLFHLLQNLNYQLIHYLPK